MKTRCPLPEVQDECDDGKVRRIVDIEEPAVQIFVPDISALSVIHRDRYEREKSTILKPAKINQ